jgi:hypothetical protein
MELEARQPNKIHEIKVEKAEIKNGPGFSSTVHTTIENSG